MSIAFALAQQAARWPRNRQVPASARGRQHDCCPILGPRRLAVELPRTASRRRRRDDRIGARPSRTRRWYLRRRTRRSAQVVPTQFNAGAVHRHFAWSCTPLASPANGEKRGRSTAPADRRICPWHQRELRLRNGAACRLGRRHPRPRSPVNATARSAVTPDFVSRERGVGARPPPAAAAIACSPARAWS